MPRLAYLAAVSSILSLLGVACSSSDGDGGATTSPEGGASGSVLGTDAGDSGLTFAQQEACDQAVDDADEQVYRSTGAEYPNPRLYACATDDDCVAVSSSTKCAAECDVAIARSQTTAYAAAIASVNGTICAQVSGCTGFDQSCSKLTTPMCAGGSCTFGLPAAWSSFVIESDSGGGGSTLPASCSGTSCTSWTITPDARVIVSDGSAVVRTVALAAPDFATVDGILRSATFRYDETVAISCAHYSGPEHVSESVQRAGFLFGGDVTSCVDGMLVGDAGPTASNDYLTLYNAVNSY